MSSSLPFPELPDRLRLENAQLDLILKGEAPNGATFYLRPPRLGWDDPLLPGPDATGPTTGPTTGIRQVNAREITL